MSKKRKSQRKKSQSLKLAKKNQKTVVDYLLPFGEPKGDTFQSLINPDYFLAPPGARGLRSTLASQLCRILIAAEQLFGERDHSYTFLGFEFVNGAPRLLPQYDGNYLIMQLYISAMHDPVKAYAQLAHEAIHMLSPRRTTPMSVLEEGLAYFFANWYILDNFGVMPPQSELPSYDEALFLVDQLMLIDGLGIKKIRKEEFVISKITAELIMKYYPTISEETAKSLASPFVRG